MFVFPAGLLLYCLHGAQAAAAANISCNSSSVCLKQLGPGSECSQDLCQCDDFHHPGDNTSCVECPGMGESCDKFQCCNRDYLMCYGGVCVCPYSDLCWPANETTRERFQRVAQCVMAVALVLTATILFILFWKACTSRTIVRRHMMHTDSFLSLNSLQRLVLMQLQDRPPPYSRDYLQPWKTTLDQNEFPEAPPSYIEAVGSPELSQGEDNLVFSSSEFPSATTISQASLGPQSANTVLTPLQNSSSSTNNTETELQNTILSGSSTSVNLQSNAVSEHSPPVSLQNTTPTQNEAENPLQHPKINSLTSNDAYCLNSPNSLSSVNTVSVILKNSFNSDSDTSSAPMTTTELHI